jgi:hypothetical protein
MPDQRAMCWHRVHSITEWNANPAVQYCFQAVACTRPHVHIHAACYHHCRDSRQGTTRATSSQSSTHLHHTSITLQTHFQNTRRQAAPRACFTLTPQYWFSASRPFPCSTTYNDCAPAHASHADSKVPEAHNCHKQAWGRQASPDSATSPRSRSQACCASSLRASARQHLALHSSPHVVRPCQESSSAGAGMGAALGGRRSGHKCQQRA